MYLPQNWELGSALSKLRNFRRGFELPKPPLSVHHCDTVWLYGYMAQFTNCSHFTCLVTFLSSCCPTWKVAPYCPSQWFYTSTPKHSSSHPPCALLLTTLSSLYLSDMLRPHTLTSPYMQTILSFYLSLGTLILSAAQSVMLQKPYSNILLLQTCISFVYAWKTNKCINY
jgi:hypothetical protein